MRRSRKELKPSADRKKVEVCNVELGCRKKEMELSKSLQKSLYKEVCSDVVGRLSVGLGVSKEELFGILGGSSPDENI